jgi:hypothetical protein
MINLASHAEIEKKFTGILSTQVGQVKRDIDICPGDSDQGISACDIAASSVELQIYADLFGIRHRSAQKTRTVEGNISRGEKNFVVSSMERERI